jgi:uridylate kinase
MKNETIIISLGGSLIVPEEVDVEFLKKFRQLIIKHIKKGKMFVIIAGGGKTARKYINAAGQITKLTSEDLDWMGIHSTRLNAQLIKIIFKEYAKINIIKNPTDKLKISRKERVIVASGWKPGCSTDYDAILLAKNLGVKKMINLSNIDYVYDRDPRKFKDAKFIKEINWKDFRKIVGDRWDPGLNAPFDPIASKEAQKLNMQVIITNGKDLANLDKILSGKKGFKGTVIE